MTTTNEKVVANVEPTVSAKQVWCVKKEHAIFNEVLQGWKDNMSTATSKLILGRIQWTEETGLLPLLILGVKGSRIRYAAHGGSDDIRYMDVTEWLKDSANLYQLEATNNDEVNAWRLGIKEVVQVKTEKVAAGRPKVEAKKVEGTVISASFNNAALRNISLSSAAMYKSII